MGTQHRNHPASAAHEGEQKGLLYSGGGGGGGGGGRRGIPKISIMECKVDNQCTICQLFQRLCELPLVTERGSHRVSTKQRRETTATVATILSWQSLFCKTWTITSHGSQNFKWAQAALEEVDRYTSPWSEAILYIYDVLQQRDSTQSWVISWLLLSKTQLMLCDERSSTLG